MSVYPAALAAHLEGETTTVCHCWRVTRTDGTVLGFTDHDGPLMVDGTTFLPQTGFTASEARDTLGLGVDTVDVEGALSSDAIADADIEDGLYDDASVETLLVNWRDSASFARLRKATVGRITRRDGAFVVELKSPTHALDQVNGRYVSRRCDAELGDARCGVALSTSTVRGAGVVTGMPAPDVLAVSGLDAFASGWFALGRLTCTSGARAGRTAYVLGHARASAGVTLSLRPGDRGAVSPGDTFEITAGCDKSFATCRAKFANGFNFRGFPHLPGNDAAYGYATDGDLFDGGALVP